MSEPKLPNPIEATSPPPARRLNRLTLGLGLAIGALMFTAGALVLTAPKAPHAQVAGPKDQRPADPVFLNNQPRRPVTGDREEEERIAALLRDAARTSSPSGPFALGPQTLPPPGSPGTPGAAARPSLPAGAAGGSGTPPAQDDELPPPGAYRPFPGYGPVGGTGRSLPSGRQVATSTPKPSWEMAFASSMVPASAATAAAAAGALPALTPPAFTAPPSIPVAAAPTASNIVSPSGAPSQGAGPLGEAVTTGPPQRGVVAKAATHLNSRFLPAGSVVNAILLTAVSTEMPGDVVAHVIHDVYAQDGSVLLPRGTRLVGSYQNRVALGEHRLGIAWDRLQIGGRSYELPGLPSTSPDGAAGLPGSVDNHTGLVFGRAALLSLVGAAAQLGQPRQSRLGASLSDREVVAGSVAQQLSAAATEFLNKAVNVAPTLFIPAGARVTVLLPYDLDLHDLREFPNS